MAKIGERHDGLIANIDHTLQDKVWMCQLLKRVRQYHDVKAVGCKAMQTIVDIFLNHVQPSADGSG